MGSMRAAVAALSCAVATAAGAWSIISPGVGTFSSGISFNADGKTGYCAVGVNGQAAGVIKSIDGGVSWNPTVDAFELMVLDVTSEGNNIASMGALAAEFSTDAMNFNMSNVTGGMGVGQCIRNLGQHDAPDGFAMVGTFGLANPSNGVAISTDAGATYTPFNITRLVTDPRYGAFPSASTWYITAGQWPGEGSDDQHNDQPTTTPPNTIGSTVRRVNARRSIVSTAEGIRYAFAEPSLGDARKMQASNASYAAQVVKTTDGGATFQSVFFRTNWAYPNGIDCLDEKRCCFGAENDDSNGFAAIVCTFNGGATWNQTLVTTVAGSTIMDLRVVGTDGYWAVGGVESSIAATANFYYSADAGQTWTLDSTIAGSIVSSVDCAVGTQECWATLLDVTTQEASIAYASTI